MKNQMDSRNVSAHEIVKRLRAIKSVARGGPCFVAILGPHRLDAAETAQVLDDVWPRVEREIGFNPVRVVTGCADVGAEKAARLVARRVTGNLAVVFHRAELTYGKRAAGEMRDILLAQEADVLLLLTTGRAACKHARDMFTSRGKDVVELEVEVG